MTRFADRLIAVILLIIAIGLLWMSTSFPDPGQPADPGTAAMPRIIAVALGLLAILLFFRAEPATIAPERGARFRTGSMVIATAAYAVLIEPVGFVVATVAFLIVALVLMGVRRPVPLLLVPLGLTLAVYFLFTAALSVYLPQGLLEGVIP